MANRYPGKCFRCNKPIGKGEGHIQKAFMKKGIPFFLLRCQECVGKGNLLPINQKKDA